MSPRKSRRRDETPPPLRTGGWAVAESHPDGEWMVRPISADAAVKEYRCPGCQQEVRPGLAHIVAWRPGEESHRRHWHTPCWRARARRR
ncbi:MAG TPA: hypothetical protein VG899_08745 [Mycobacteriales bacterium]|nr:hypothetical protein [Mycobacteriales bacterium]HWA66440.1 hypothetical protein [Mycobacteriales bacterium]